mmetsp:Transcript_87187/g.244656  ORF Transcript_87187/g.244656 Transcript_87187/m.244656 type:complete len:303 (+) Transcript_87187:448-1356(+)
MALRGDARDSAPGGNRCASRRARKATTPAAENDLVPASGEKPGERRRGLLILPGNRPPGSLIRQQGAGCRQRRPRPVERRRRGTALRRCNCGGVGVMGRRNKDGATVELHEQSLDGVRYDERVERVWRRETIANGGLEKFQQRRVHAVHVHHSDGLSVAPSAGPLKGFEQLLQRADAPGEPDESVALLEHQAFPLSHVLDNVEPREAPMLTFQILHEAGDDTHDLAAGCERRVGKHAHQTDAPTAIDHREATLCQQPATNGGGRLVGGFGPERRAAVDRASCDRNRGSSHRRCRALARAKWA